MFYLSICSFLFCVNFIFRNINNFFKYVFLYYTHINNNNNNSYENDNLSFYTHNKSEILFLSII